MRVEVATVLLVVISRKKLLACLSRDGSCSKFVAPNFQSARALAIGCPSPAVDDCQPINAQGRLSRLYQHVTPLHECCSLSIINIDNSKQ